MRYLYIGAGSITAVIAILLLLNFNESKGIQVDAFKDQTSVAVFYRVMIKNNYDKELKNISVDFGNHVVNIPRLEPHESIVVYPKEDITSNYVIVKADPDIVVKKEFRTAIKMPGMIGGMG